MNDDWMNVTLKFKILFQCISQGMGVAAGPAGPAMALWNTFWQGLQSAYETGQALYLNLYGSNSQKFLICLFIIAQTMTSRKTDSFVAGLKIAFFDWASWKGQLQGAVPGDSALTALPTYPWPKSSVAAQISANESRAVFLHFYGHSLAMCDTSKPCKTHDAMDVAHEMKKVVKFSFKRKIKFVWKVEGLSHSAITRVLSVMSYSTCGFVQRASKMLKITNYKVLQQLWESVLRS